MTPPARPQRYCCDEFRSAAEAAFANPIDGPTGWILYGTDHDSVIRGEPELRYWPVRFCPFCGAALKPRGSRSSAG